MHHALGHARSMASRRGTPFRMLSSMAFIGREHELELLARALEAGADGRMSRVAITGAAGIGVTRVIDELLARVAAIDSVVVARGTAREPTRGVPFSAAGAALSGALAASSDERLAAIVG